jgi:hypothetical protein
MQPAGDIVMQINRFDLALRPTLRAATLLEQSHGFDKLLIDVANGNIGTMADIVRHANGADLLRLLACVPLLDVMAALIDALSRYVLVLAGVDPDNIKPADDTGGERMSYREFFAKLYRIATGWLGWSPETAWNATTHEILEAYKGHLEMLRAVHGSTDPDAKPDTPDKATFDRDGLGELRAMQGNS